MNSEYNLDVHIYEKETGEQHKQEEIDVTLKRYMKYLEKIENYYRKNSKIMKFEIISKNPPTIRLKDNNNSNNMIWEISDHDPDDPNYFKWVKVIEHDDKNETLTLDKLPKTSMIKIKPNTNQIRKQQIAISKLRKHPQAHYKPIIKLFENYNEWKYEDDENVKKWYVLQDDSRDGVNEQREFVKKALNTPDFAILEGPPGSGKTTVLCELVHQLIAKKKRILFCASTHVAVDNLLEKLIKTEMGDIIPVRIGIDEKISEQVRQYNFKEFVNAKGKEIIGDLSSRAKSRSQKKMLEILKQGDNEMEEIIRDCTNLVCGTPIGVLQYPNIKNEISNDKFDVMILDEASKTTFQEFLVPALYAKRWIIVGDTKQLSPYTDSEELATNIDGVLEDKQIEEVYLDVFFASKDNTIVIVVDYSDDGIVEKYAKRCGAMNVEFYNLDKREHDGGKGIIIGISSRITKINLNGPCKIRNYEKITPINKTKNKKNKYPNKQNSNPNIKNWKKYDISNDENYVWSKHIAWRMVLHYHNTRKMVNEIKPLMPDFNTEEGEEFCNMLSDIKNIAMSSVMECIQYGDKEIIWEPESNQDKDIVWEPESNESENFIRWMPEDDFKDRHVLLKYQHRMHSQIASFSKTYIYDNKALLTSDSIDKRAWPYPEKNRCKWINIINNHNNNSEENESEVRQIISEIKKIDEFMSKHRNYNEKYTVAVLSFYNKQVTLIRKELRKIANDNNGWRYFKIKALNIELCTVDKYQGHETDIVFISFVKSRYSPFLDNPNRLNVAITRARHQCILVGNKKIIPNRKNVSDDSVLKKMIETIKEDIIV